MTRCVQLPGLALCAALCAAFGTLALLLLTAPKRARGARAVGRSAKAQKAKAPAAPVSPRGRVAPTDSFSFDAAEPAAGVTTPTLGGKKAAKAAPKSKTPAPRKTPAKRAPAASPEPPAPVASPVTSPARGRPSARKSALPDTHGPARLGSAESSSAHLRSRGVSALRACRSRRPWPRCADARFCPTPQLLPCRAWRARRRGAPRPLPPRLRRRRLRRSSRSNPPPASPARAPRAAERRSQRRNDACADRPSCELCCCSAPV